MQIDLSRREMVAATGGFVALMAGGRLLGDPPADSRVAKPDKAPSSPTGPADPANPAVGKPVSATAAAQGGVPTVPAPPGPKVRFALVGLGKLLVEEVLPALRETSLCEVTALVTGDPNKGRAIAATLGIDVSRVFEYGDILRFRDDAEIDAVYIATPNALHMRDTVAALKAGKHVLCEKPLASTLADSEAMVSAAARANRKLMAAYRVHHEPINQQMRQWLREKKYGKPHFIAFDAVQDVGRKPQHRLDARLAGGGSLFDIGIYALNTTCWLLGEEPTEVAAMQWNDPADERFDEVEENIAFHLRFPSGCIATCTSSYGTARVNRYRIMCERGWMGMGPATNYRGLRGEHGTEKEQVTMSEPESVNQFAAEFDHFAQCIREKRPVESPGEEGHRDIRLMLKIYEAARTGRTMTTA